jgi:alpha-ribazole phosphatase
VHAILNAAGLPGELPVDTSPLQRCALLARRLQPRSLRVDPRLAGLDFPRLEVDAWTVDLLHYRPGGAGSVLDVARRVAAFAADLRRAGHVEALLICHAGTIRLLAAIRDGESLEPAALNAARTPHRIGYGEVLAVELKD